MRPLPQFDKEEQWLLFLCVDAEHKAMRIRLQEDSDAHRETPLATKLHASSVEALRRKFLP